MIFTDLNLLLLLPTRSTCRFLISAALLLLLFRKFTLAQDRLDPRDFLPRLAELARVFQLFRHRLAPQVEQVLGLLQHLPPQVLGALVPKFFQPCLHDSLPSSLLPTAHCRLPTADSFTPPCAVASPFILPCWLLRNLTRLGMLGIETPNQLTVSCQLLVASQLLPVRCLRCLHWQLATRNWQLAYQRRPRRGPPPGRTSVSSTSS